MSCTECGWNVFSIKDAGFVCSLCGEPVGPQTSGFYLSAADGVIYSSPGAPRDDPDDGVGSPSYREALQLARVALLAAGKALPLSQAQAWARQASSWVWASQAVLERAVADWARRQ